MAGSSVRARFGSTLAAVGGAAVASLVVAAPASAHPGHHLGGAADGLLHPLTGLDHLLAMVAVGIVAATASDRRMTWRAPAAFVGGMVLGGVAGLGGLPMPGAETLIVASVILLGLVVAGAIRTEGRWLLALLAVAGVAHGHAHGAEAPAAAHPAAYVAGFLVSTIALHVVGVLGGTAIRDRWALRVGIGAATATAGALLFLGVA